MKATIKELAKREGKKSQVAIGNLKEVISKLQDMLAEELVNNFLQVSNGEKITKTVFTGEFLDTIAKKSNAIVKKKKSKVKFEIIQFHSGIDDSKV